MKPKMKILLSAIATLIGTVVGAGFLGIPKALTMSGFLPGLIIMIIVAIAMFFMCLFTTELALNTKKVYQTPGMIGKYLGKKWGIFSSILFALISFGAMVAYLLGSSQILSNFTGINQLICMIFYFAVIFLLVFKGLKIIEKAELYLGIGMILFLIILGIFLFPDLNFNNLFVFQINDLIIPFGVIIFSFGGYNVMTQIELITNGDKDLMVKTSLIGTLIPFFFFLIFAVLMLAVFGNSISDIATESLTGVLGLIGNLIAFLAMTSSYIISGLLWRDMLVDDYGMNKTISSLIAMFLPFLFTIFASPTFMNTLSFTGAVFAGLFAIIIAITVIVHRKKIRKSYYKTPGGIITPILTIILFSFALIVTLL